MHALRVADREAGELAVPQTALDHADRLAQVAVTRCVGGAAALQYSQLGRLRVLLFTDRERPA
jgi:hypothetical protein